ncbi:hypothetical protein [Collimonas fungivorans]|uniref:hypothetical protein n=1 Tax=Collimonas fungivorans TaxID=158899 RepID=UPI003FA39027
MPPDPNGSCNDDIQLTQTLPNLDIACGEPNPQWWHRYVFFQIKIIFPNPQQQLGDTRRKHFLTI